MFHSLSGRGDSRASASGSRRFVAASFCPRLRVSFSRRLSRLVHALTILPVPLMAAVGRRVRPCARGRAECFASFFVDGMAARLSLRERCGARALRLCSADGGPAGRWGEGRKRGVLEHAHGRSERRQLLVGACWARVGCRGFLVPTVDAQEQGTARCWSYRWHSLSREPSPFRNAMGPMAVRGGFAKRPGH